MEAGLTGPSVSCSAPASAVSRLFTPEAVAMWNRRFQLLVNLPGINVHLKQMIASKVLKSVTKWFYHTGRTRFFSVLSELACHRSVTDFPDTVCGCR